MSNQIIRSVPQPTVPLPADVKDATATLAVNVDDKHARTAILLSTNPTNGKAYASVDVMVDGERMCRLNLFAFGFGAGDVDVILDPETQRGRFLAWSKGVTMIDATPPEAARPAVYAVDIHPRRPSSGAPSK